MDDETRTDAASFQIVQGLNLNLCHFRDNNLKLRKQKYISAFCSYAADLAADNPMYDLNAGG